MLVLPAPEGAVMMMILFWCKAMLGSGCVSGEGRGKLIS
jgi:hypothetical protein